jgi:AhpD family alkylhydroperoxidase
MEVLNLSNDSLYKKSNIHKLAELGKMVPDTFKAFVSFDQKALAPGVLPKKLKELMAIAIAHVTGCPYCIEGHVKNAKRIEASKEEIMEAIMVATALKAGSALAHGINALNAFDDSNDNELYQKSSMNRLTEFKDINPELFNAFVSFDSQVMKASLLNRKEKELIAIAVAHVTGCAYCIESHTKKAKVLGVTLEELTETIFVAGALKGGSAIAHSVNAFNAYNEL